MLKKRGLKVAVLEAGKIGQGNTAGTTAKITLLHDLCYDKIIKKHGLEKAKLYAKANNEAINLYEQIISENKIECDFKRCDFHIFATTEKGKQDIIKEHKATQKLKLDMEMVSETELPFKIKVALRAKNQAQFHPLKYISAISELIEGNGSFVFENTVVSEVTANKKIITDNGHITAKYVIIATHYPIINVPGYYLLRMYQHRSSVIAFRGKPLKEIGRAHV